VAKNGHRDPDPLDNVFSVEDETYLKRAREAFATITKKTFEAWMDLVKGVQVCDRRAEQTSIKSQRLLKRAGLGVLNERKHKTLLSNMRKIGEHYRDVVAWHAGLPQHLQWEWASPSAVVKHCPIFKISADASEDEDKSGKDKTPPTPMEHLAKLRKGYIAQAKMLTAAERADELAIVSKEFGAEAKGAKTAEITGGDIEPTDTTAETFEQLKPRVIELLKAMRPNERVLAFDSLAMPFEEIDVRGKVGNVEFSTAAAREKAKTAKSKPKAKAKTDGDPLKWKDKKGMDDHYSGEAAAAKGVYRVSATSVTALAPDMPRRFKGYLVFHSPTGKVEDRRTIAECVMDYNEAKAIAQRDHDAGKDR
jgi:hypothetical protein